MWTYYERNCVLIRVAAIVNPARQLRTVDTAQPAAQELRDILELETLGVTDSRMGGQ
jgi:hypothetical protein